MRALSDVDHWTSEEGPLHQRFGELIREDQDTLRQLCSLGHPETPAGTMLAARLALRCTGARRWDGTLECETFEVASAGSHSRRCRCPRTNDADASVTEMARRDDGRGRDGRDVSVSTCTTQKATNVVLLADCQRPPAATIDAQSATPDPDPSQFLWRLDALLLLMEMLGPPWVRETGDARPHPRGLAPVTPGPG